MGTGDLRCTNSSISVANGGLKVSRHVVETKKEEKKGNSDLLV